MSTRALMELIVLNIGFDLGFIPPKVFTMLVIMAVVTTIMTGPLLRLLLPAPVTSFRRASRPEALTAGVQRGTVGIVRRATVYQF